MSAFHPKRTLAMPNATAPGGVVSGVSGGPRPQPCVLVTVVYLLPAARRSGAPSLNRENGAAPFAYLQRLLANRRQFRWPGNEGTHHENFWHRQFVRSRKWPRLDQAGNR